MKYVVSFMAGALAFAAPVLAQSDVERGFAGAVRGCEEWILNPASWVDGVGPFIAAVGLGHEMGLVDNVPEISLPPSEFQSGNQYWRINSTAGAGYVLVVSDQLPMCHITGGGDTDLQPAIEAVLASEGFGTRWLRVSSGMNSDMMTTVFQHREAPSLSITISHASQPGQRLDRVQVLATATYAMSN